MVACHAERRIRQPIGPVFDLIADIESYPRFLPGWRSARILHRDEDRLLVHQEVGVGGLRLSFISTALIERPHRLDIGSTDPPFRSFRLLWQLAKEGGGTLVQADMSLAFRKPWLDLFVPRLTRSLLPRVIDAFVREASARRLGERRDHVAGG